VAEQPASIAKRDQNLYERYGRPLEKNHRGEFVAISPQGETILGSHAADVLRRAVERFGSGNFALKRVGYRAFGRWLTING
jgi:hypothetical protein